VSSVVNFLKGGKLMEKSVLKAKIRDKTGKSYVKKLKKRGYSPGVLYGPHLKKSLSLEVDTKELISFIHGLSGEEKVITLQLTNQTKNKEREVIIKDIQSSLLKREIQHVDFYEITRGEKITTLIPLILVGEDRVTKKGGVVVERLIREIEIECFPKDIPPHIEVDLTNLNVGDLIRTKDLNLPPKVKLITNPEEMVVSLVSSISEKELEKLEEEKKAPEEVEVVSKEKEAEEITEKEEPPPEKRKK